MRWPTILIVDDEPRNCRTLLEALLHAEGYVTVSVGSGEDALAEVARQAPDLILLDLMIRGRDGYEVAKVLKADRATANIPVVMLTAQADTAARLVGLEAGADDSLTKPIDQAELWLRVRNLLRLKTYGDFLENHRAILDAERQAAEQRLHHLAHYDPLTGLPNRTLFYETLDEGPGPGLRTRGGASRCSSSTSTTSRTSTTRSGAPWATRCSSSSAIASPGACASGTPSDAWAVTSSA